MHADADFLAAVAAHPHDPLTRLVYADWLDERSDPRGELVRIEEAVRFEPAWSDVLWSQKPRRNELRAKCDPAWLAAMRYGTDCLPLFYGRPFPDHWRDGWRLIREATERWLGVPMPDVGGHADEVAAVEQRLGLALPPSVREFVAYVEDMKVLDEDGHWPLRDPFVLDNVPGSMAFSLMQLAEGDYHWAVQRADFSQPNPPVYRYTWQDHEGISVWASDSLCGTLTEFLFDYAFWCLSDSHGALSVQVAELARMRAQLCGALGIPTSWNSQDCFEVPNISAILGSSSYSPGYLAVNVARPVARIDIPDCIWDLIDSGDAHRGIFREEILRRRALAR